MELFYNKNINDKTEEFNLDGIENNHINKVLRKKEGDILTFTNGKNLMRKKISSDPNLYDKRFKKNILYGASKSSLWLSFRRAGTLAKTNII